MKLKSIIATLEFFFELIFYILVAIFNFLKNDNFLLYFKTYLSKRGFEPLL
jgi:hypothetical protein